MVGVGCGLGVTVKVKGGVVNGPGLTTVIGTGPARLTIAAVIGAVRVVPLTKVVVSPVAPKKICEPLTKAGPLTVRVKPGDPATTDTGTRAEMADAITVKVVAGDVDPPGFTTVTLTGPKADTWEALTWAVRVPEPLKVVASGVPPKTICDPGR